MHLVERLKGEWCTGVCLYVYGFNYVVCTICASVGIIINKANFLLAVATQVKSQITLISDLIFYMLDFWGFRF